MNFIKKIKTAFVILIIIPLLTSCYLLPREEEILAPPLIEPSRITYSLFEVKKADIERVVTVTAYFVSAVTKNLFFDPSGGRIKSVYVSLGDIVEEGQLIIELNTGNLLDDIRIQEINRRKAEIAHQRLVASGADSYSLEIALGDLEIADIRLENLRSQLEKARLYAPISGKVSFIDTRLTEGSFVNAFQTLASIVDPDDLLLVYSGQRHSDFKPDMLVDIKIRDNEYTGSVLMTASNAPVDISQDMRTTVIYEMDELPEDAKSGTSAAISVILERSEDTIVLPKNLIRQYLGRKYVIILNGDIREERDIQTGVETATEAEILKGLEVGDLVIIR